MNIEVKLLHHTPIEILIGAIRQCYESQENSDSKYGYISTHTPPLKSEIFILGPKDKALVERIVESGHTSTLEHCSFNFQIKGISRLNLQELARHRMASLSVKSTRYTLKELKDEPSFIDENETEWRMHWERASKYVNFINKEEIDLATITALENLRRLVASGNYKNDEAKYAVPESYKLDLYWTINLRSLLNFLELRDSPRAHFEIRELAQKIHAAVPKEFYFILEKAKSLQ